MKRVLLVSLVILVLGNLIITGCAPPAPTPAPAPAPAAATPLAPVKTIELKFAHHNAPASVAAKSLETWAKKVEDATKGVIKITIYPAQTLCKSQDTFEAIKTQVTDIGWAYIGLFPGPFPMTSIMWLPCISVPTAEISSRILMDLYNKFPEMQKEYASTKTLFLHSDAPAIIGTSKKPIRKLEDLKGLKLRITGDLPIEFMKSQGAVPVALPPGDMYLNVQKNVVEGYSISLGGLSNFKMEEVTKYITEANWYAGAFFCLMNLDKWNSLPPDIQKAIDTVSSKAGSDIWARDQDLDQDRLRKMYVDKYGIELINLSVEESARWRQAAKPIHDKWASDIEAKGLPGKKVFDEFIQLVQKYTR